MLAFQAPVDADFIDEVQKGEILQTSSIFAQHGEGYISLNLASFNKEHRLYRSRAKVEACRREVQEAPWIENS